MYLIKCGACGFKFFSDEEELITPVEILRRYSFRCPSCLKKLNFDPKNIKINSAKIDRSRRSLRKIPTNLVLRNIKTDFSSLKG
jgi:hypothetical protein